MLRRRKEPEFIHGVALREDIDPIVDWSTAADHYEHALRAAQEGHWEQAHELRDQAREMLGR